jgi:hypothetical protein
VSETRDARLKADKELLAALQAASTIFTCEPSGESAERYTLTFRGKGLARDSSAQSDVAIVELHQVDLRMPYSYPSSPPDIRWLTPIWHPNVSFSGFVNLADVGLVWTKEVPLDVVCQRLWDVARGEYRNESKATNYAAKNWFEKECEFSLPVDPRPLRDKGGAASSNVVRYQRRAGQGVQLAGAAREVMFIDENTPTPDLPERQAYVPAARRRPRGDGDVLYIGPE